MTDTCGCPRHQGRSVSDPERHTAWHAETAAQGVPGPVTYQTLRAARGLAGGTPSGETVLDERARASGKRASGRLREACR